MKPTIGDIKKQMAARRTAIKAGVPRAVVRATMQTGPGSRMRKYMCKHGQIIRAARDDLEAKCTICESRFTLREPKT